MLSLGSRTLRAVVSRPPACGHFMSWCLSSKRLNAACNTTQNSFAISRRSATAHLRPQQFGTSVAFRQFSNSCKAANESMDSQTDRGLYGVVNADAMTTVSRTAFAPPAVSVAETYAASAILSPGKRSRPAFVGDEAIADEEGRKLHKGFSTDLSRALKSVVKIFTTAANPNFSQPWQMHSQTKSTATGFVVAGHERRILTNAHAVSNQMMVQVRKHGNAKKYSAKVLAVGHECDIAMLTVEDDEFWLGTCALEIHGLPAMQESVTVVGFPQGGDNVCVTKGVVSRIDRQQYSHGRFSLLTIQIDAAINSGNSGGPVLLDNKVVGIAFQCLTAGENIGYIIPVPVINHFLNDLKRHDGSYTGFCVMGVNWQTLENSDMKSFLNMPSTLTGVYVTKVEPTYQAAKVLQAGDVITHFNDVEIADDGTFLYQQSVRIDFGHLVSMYFNGDHCKLSVWRNGAAIQVEVELSTPKQLVPKQSHDVKPSYFIYAGLVFTKLSCWYLSSMYGSDWACKAPIKLAERALCASMNKDGEEVVVLAKVLASNINSGYQDWGNTPVLKVNGRKIHNLAHLAQLVDGNKADDYLRFDLEYHKVMIINNTKARAAADDILSQNSIPAAYSKGLLTEPVPVDADVDSDESEQFDLDEEPAAHAVGRSHEAAGSSSVANDDDVENLARKVGKARL